MAKRLLAVFVILTALLTLSPSLFAYEKNINCGGPQYTAVSGDIYIADQQYTPNNMAGYVSGSIGSTTHTISGTSDQTLYQTELWNVSEHKFDLPNGFYNVTLKFVEMYFTSASQRVFSVWIEGKKLISDLDIFRQAGHDAALNYTFTVEVKDGQLNIQQYATQGTTTISAIQVKSLVTPQPQQLSLKGFNLTLDPTWNIAVNFSDTDDYFAAQQLQNYIYTKYNLNIPLLNSPLISGTKYIVLANPTKDTSIQNLLTQRNLYPETSLNEEGYLLEGYSDNMIIISSNTPKGIFYGTQTLKQLISSSNNITTTNAVRIKDWPDNKMRGMHIMGIPDGMDGTKAKLDYMASLKMNMVIFDEAGYFYLDRDNGSGRTYRSVFQEVFNYARQRHFEVIPQVISFSNPWPILQLDPYCIEGLSAKDEQFKFINNLATPVNPVNVTITNPGFEIANPNDATKPYGWTFSAERNDWSWDNTIYHSGTHSVKVSVPGPNNVRTNLLTSEIIEATHNTYYNLTFWVMTQGLGGTYNPAIRIVELDSSGNWIRQHSAEVNSTYWGKGTLDLITSSNCAKIYIYANIWDGYGTTWFDDISLRRMNGALVDVIRTPSSNIVITNLAKTKTYVEGIDYKVTDGVMIYPYSVDHTPTTIERILTGGIADGETVLITYDFGLSFPAGAPYCPSESRTYNIMFAALSDVIQSFNPKYIAVAHDEIRGMNRDSRCQKRNMTNAQLLAEDLNKLNDYIHSINSNIRMMLWDDMLNPWHNGGDANYQVEFGGPPGATGPALDLISKDIILKIWWYDSSDWLNKMANSPSYFKSKGFDYMVSPWYNEKNIRMWTDILREKKDSFGVLDTAWLDAPQAISWSGLTPSADYSWCYKGIPYAVSSSNESYDTQAANAIDANTSTRWASQWSDPQWIYIDFTTPKTFDAVKLTWETAYAKQYQIQISNNAVNWTTIYTENNSDGGLDIIPTGPQTARYVRIYGTQRGTQWGYSLYEFEVGNFSPQAYYPMDENTGTIIYDTSSNHNDGTIYGAIWTTGVLGSALQFDGINDYVQVANSPSLNAKDELTINFWFKFNAIPIWWNRVLEKGLWTSDNIRGSYRIVTGKDVSTIAFQIYLQGGQVRTIWSPALELNKWNHLVATYKPNQMSLYINGNLVANDTTVTGQLQQTADPLCIGADSGHGENFNGSIDTVKIYNRALNQQEIIEEYKNSKPTATASSMEGSSTSPDKAIDNNLSTRWSSLFSDPQWICIDFKQPKAFSTVTLNWETAYGRAYQIQISNDALTWTTIYSTTTSAGGIQTINVGARTARYVRMYGTQRGTQWGYSLWEFGVN